MPQPFKFAGAYHDSETGLYKMGARYYDPQVGRFTQPDLLPLNPYDPLSWDPYAYTGNNPVNWVDPTGLFHKRCWRCFVQAIFGGVTAGTGVAITATGFSLLVIGAVESASNPVAGLHTIAQGINFITWGGVVTLTGVGIIYLAYWPPDRKSTTNK